MDNWNKGLFNKNGEWTKVAVIHKAKTAGLLIGTWSPGDNVMRYRFEHATVPGAGDYDATDGIFTALGLNEARIFVAGYIKGKAEGRAGR